MLVHVVTREGKGYGPAEDFGGQISRSGQFDVVSCKQDKGRAGSAGL